MIRCITTNKRKRQTFMRVSRLASVCGPLPAMLGRPFTTTHFDGLTTDICRTNGEAENRILTE
jgi:hypothetical protein